MLKIEVHLVKFILTSLGALLLMTVNGQECFDPNGDCSLAMPVEFNLDFEVNCGDTLLLQSTQEICNQWTIASDINFFYGTGNDSASVYFISEHCTSDVLVVDGVTNTPSGTGIASCNTRIIYTISPSLDTVQQELSCGEYQALESPIDTLISSCGCDSLVVNYFNIEIVDTAYVTDYSCLETELGIQSDTLTSLVTGCDSIVITTTELIPVSEITADNQQACEGENILLYVDTEEAETFLWETGENTPFIEVMEEGSYSVTVTDINGCESVITLEASYTTIDIAIEASVAELFLVNESPLEVWQGAAIQMDAYVQGTLLPFEIIWNGGPEVGDTTYNFVAQESGELKVGVIDEQGCIAIETLEVIVRPINIYVPNAFSPNQDQTNDLFNIYTSPNVEEVRLQVFSRIGSMVFDQKLDPVIEQQGLKWSAWDGTFNGTKMLPQVFVYQLWYRGIRGEWNVTAGDISLMR